MKGSTKKFAIGTIFAAIAGYIAGILTAPKSGKETRKDIQAKAIKAKSDAEKQLKNLHSELDKLLEQAKNSAKKIKKDSAEEFAEVVSKGHFAKEKARQILSALHDGDANDKDLKKALEEVKKSISHLKTFLSKNNSN